MWTPRTMISAVSVAAVLLVPVPAAAEPMAGLVGPAVTVPGDGAAATSASPATSTGQAATMAVTVTATIPVGFGPSWVATNPLTNTVYVANRGDNTVSVIGS